MSPIFRTFLILLAAGAIGVGLRSIETPGVGPALLYWCAIGLSSLLAAASGAAPGRRRAKGLEPAPAEETGALARPWRGLFLGLFASLVTQILLLGAESRAGMGVMHLGFHGGLIALATAAGLAGGGLARGFLGALLLGAGILAATLGAGVVVASLADAPELDVLPRTLTDAAAAGALCALLHRIFARRGPGLARLAGRAAVGLPVVVALAHLPLARADRASLRAALDAGTPRVLGVRALAGGRTLLGTQVEWEDVGRRRGEGRFPLAGGARGRVLVADPSRGTLAPLEGALPEYPALAATGEVILPLPRSEATRPCGGPHEVVRLDLAGPAFAPAGPPFSSRAAYEAPSAATLARVAAGAGIALTEAEAAPLACAIEVRTSEAKALARSSTDVVQRLYPEAAAWLVDAPPVPQPTTGTALDLLVVDLAGRRADRVRIARPHFSQVATVTRVQGAPRVLLLERSRDPEKHERARDAERYGVALLDPRAASATALPAPSGDAWLEAIGPTFAILRSAPDAESERRGWSDRDLVKARERYWIRRADGSRSSSVGWGARFSLVRLDRPEAAHLPLDRDGETIVRADVAPSGDLLLWTLEGVRVISPEGVERRSAPSSPEARAAFWGRVTSRMSEARVSTRGDIPLVGWLGGAPLLVCEEGIVALSLEDGSFGTVVPGRFSPP